MNTPLHKYGIHIVISSETILPAIETRYFFLFSLLRICYIYYAVFTLENLVAQDVVTLLVAVHCFQRMPSYILSLSGTNLVSSFSGVFISLLNQLY